MPCTHDIRIRQTALPFIFCCCCLLAAFTAYIKAPSFTPVILKSKHNATSITSYMSEPSISPTEHTTPSQQPSVSPTAEPTLEPALEPTIYAYDSMDNYHVNAVEACRILQNKIVLLNGDSFIRWLTTAFIEFLSHNETRCDFPVVNMTAALCVGRQKYTHHLCNKHMDRAVYPAAPPCVNPNLALQSVCNGSTYLYNVNANVFSMARPSFTEIINYIASHPSFASYEVLWVLGTTLHESMCDLQHWMQRWESWMLLQFRIIEQHFGNVSAHYLQRNVVWIAFHQRLMSLIPAKHHRCQNNEALLAANKLSKRVCDEHNVSLYDPWNITKGAYNQTDDGTHFGWDVNMAKIQHALHIIVNNRRTWPE